MLNHASGQQPRAHAESPPRAKKLRGLLRSRPVRPRPFGTHGTSASVTQAWLVPQLTRISEAHASAASRPACAKIFLRRMDIRTAVFAVQRHVAMQLPQRTHTWISLCAHKCSFAHVYAAPDCLAEAARKNVEFAECIFSILAAMRSFMPSSSEALLRPGN